MNEKLQKEKGYIYEAKFFDHYLQQTDGIIIYGIGKYGKKIVDYIISIGAKDKIKGIVVTNKENVRDTYQDIEIHEAYDFFCKKENQEIGVVVAVTIMYQGAITMTLEEHGIKEYYLLTREGIADVKSRLDQRPLMPYKGMDFLIAGFMKCGTTSMYHVLNGIENIYLPVGKETFFFAWYDQVENPEEELIKRHFFDIRQGQKVGAVEPSFYMHAEGIYQYFGSDTKIILMLRNPIDAAFSMFKMLNRDGNIIFDDLYQKYGVYHEEMFLRYFESVVKDSEYQFRYDYWLERFLDYFPKEQIQVTLFEELVRFPEREIARILHFIGADVKYSFTKLPKANGGDYVMGDLNGHELAKRKADLIYKMYICPESKNRIGEGYELQDEFIKVKREYEKASKISLKATEDERELLKQHFYESVRKTEKILNIKLSELWF